MRDAQSRENWRVPVAGLLILVAFTVRVYRLASQSVWLDEALMLGRATSDLATAAQGRTPLDLAPPLFPLLLHAWTGLGEGDFLVRFPSIMFSTLAVAALARAVPQARLGAALIFALAPVQIHYAQEATAYALVGLLAALALLAATWIEQGDRRGWPAFGVVAVVSAYTYYGLLFLVAGLYVRSIARRGTMIGRRSSVPSRGRALVGRPWAVALVILLACLPLLPLALRQSAATVDAWWGQYGQLTGLAGGRIFVTGLLAHGLAFPLFPFSQPPLWLLVGIACLLALGAVRRPGLFLAGWLGPLVLAYIASAWGRYPFETRYLLFAAPPLYALLASALSPTGAFDRARQGLTAAAQWPLIGEEEKPLSLRLGVLASWRLKRGRIPLSLLLALLVSAWPVWELNLPWTARPPRAETRALLAVLAEWSTPDEVVYVSYGARATVEHYQRLGLAPVDAKLEEGWPAGRVERQADHILAAGRRVWVLVAHAAPGEEQALAEALARRGAWLRQRVVAPGAAVWRLETGD